ncbi:MAG: glycerophosphodiester phosphodiesterase family protein [Sphingomicrobium sp.]
MHVLPLAFRPCRSGLRSRWMRSSRSRPEPLALPPAGFAHRGLHGAAVPENSMTAFRAAIEAGAGIECDVRLSADDVPMIFHDADLTRLCGEGGSIERMNAATLAGKRLGGTTDTIPRLAELLMLARGRVPLLVECKTRGNAARLAEAVCRTLGARPGPVGVMSFDPCIGRWLGRTRPDVRRGLVLDGNDGALVRWAKMARARPDFLAINVDRLGRPWVARARRTIPVYSWTIRTAGQRQIATADALIWEADGRP